MGAGLPGALRSTGSPIWPLIGAVILSLSTAGCRPIFPPAPSPTSPVADSTSVETAGPVGSSSSLPEHWRLEFNRSGGIAGEMKTINISDDGSFVATSEKLQQTLQGTLSEKELDEIGRLLAEVYPFPLSPRRSECKDCFAYTIRLDLGGRPSEITLDDSLLLNSGFEELVARLNSLLASELPGG